MYTAKAARSGVEFYRADLDHYRPESLALVPRFRGAIERGELGVAFQPQLDVRDGRIVGAEALVRWSLPGIGPVPPSEFIPIAESTGLIRPLTRYVLIEAIEQCANWQTLGDPVRVSVNIAPRVLLEPGLADRITHLLEMARLPPSLLRLEVTETTVMSDPERSLEVLRELCDRGMSVAIDDFGTGHSSLAYLTSRPCDELKIDRGFIVAMEEDPRVEAVVSAVVGLGHSLGLDVVAEGVETTRAADQLVAMGCRIFQGYRYGRPVPAVEFTRLLEDRPRAAAQPETDRSPAAARF
jgi:EAL domain-containing protein (putative c-di-GMP-specific phosphodiesterase class I)